MRLQTPTTSTLWTAALCSYPTSRWDCQTGLHIGGRPKSYGRIGTLLLTAIAPAEFLLMQSGFHAWVQRFCHEATS